jgi:hypothetical protein
MEKEQREPLDKRAWTLQEKWLSPRVLSFPTFSGFVFQCDKEERRAGDYCLIDPAEMPDESTVRRRLRQEPKSIPNLVFHDNKQDDDEQDDDKHDDDEYDDDEHDDDEQDDEWNDDEVERFRIYKEWVYIVHDYSARHVSNPLDKLQALAGLAELFHARYESVLGSYAAGHWLKMLPLSLSLGTKMDDIVSSPEQYLAPSWS